MKKIPRIFYRVITQVVFFLVLPLFFFVFLLLYRPERIVSFICVPEHMFYFNAIILSCILLLTMVLSRMLIFLLRHKLSLSWIFYTLWCLGEIVVCSLFESLYLTLMADGAYNYFSTTGMCVAMNILILFFPYSLATLFYLLAAQTQDTTDESRVIRFVDSNQKLRIAIASEAVMYVEAKENYVGIHYMENDQHKEYLLHNSMVGIESLMRRNGMIRCQRSYYINPQYVKILRRDKRGIIMADLTIDNTPSIPVSPKYYETLASLI